MKNILVTGGAGFIGSHTAISLIESGYNPIVVDDFRNADRGVLEGIKKITGKDLLVYEIDVCNQVQMNEVFKKHHFSGVIHFAAYKAVGESVDFPLMYYKNNLSSLISVLECMRENNVYELVFSSSCTVYGEPKNVKEVTEDSPKVEANSPYGNTKCISEEMIADFANSWPSLKAINLRYFNPVGAHPSGFVGEFPIGNLIIYYLTSLKLLLVG